VVISDFFDPHGAKSSLDAIRYRRQDLVGIHVVSPADSEPPLNGEITLVDAETRVAHDLTVTPTLLRAYADEFEAYCAELDRYCSLYGFGYVRTRTDLPFEDLVLHVLRQGRFIS